MNFICTHCGKPIGGISVVIDNTHFAHIECQKDAIQSVKLEKNIESINEMDSFYRRKIVEATAIPSNYFNN